MYKVLIIHEVMPGKLPEMKRWFAQQDAARKERDPNYTPLKRFATVLGSVHQIFIEIEAEEVPAWVFDVSYAERTADEAQREFLQWIVPGSTEIRLLKELDLESA